MLIKVIDMESGKDCYVQTDAICLIRKVVVNYAVFVAGEQIVVAPVDLDRLLKPVNEHLNMMTVTIEKDNGAMDALFERASKAFWQVMGEAEQSAAGGLIQPSTGEDGSPIKTGDE